MENWVPLTGVVVAQFVLVGLYFLKQRADDKRRWLERRLIAYSEFLALVEERTRRLGKVQASPGEQLKAYDQWRSALGPVTLLGSPAVRGAATDLFSAYLECLTRLNREELDVEDAVAEINKQESRVLRAMRKDLKIEV